MKYRYYTLEEAELLRGEDDNDSAILINSLLEKKTPEDHEKALNLIKQDYESGDPQATLMISRYYRFGDNGFEENKKLANKLLWKAAHGLNASAIFDIGIEKDGKTWKMQEKAIGYFIVSAIMGNERGRNCLADCFETGQGIGENIFLSEVIFKYIEKCHILYGSNLPSSQYDLVSPRYKYLNEGEIFFIKNKHTDYEAVFDDLYNEMQELEKCDFEDFSQKVNNEIANGNPYAHYFTGIFHYYGFGGYKKDIKKAKKIFEICANNLLKEAIFMLGQMYNGESFEERENAIVYYITSAVLTNLDACYIVAERFKSGIGIKKNRVFSHWLFKFREKILIKYLGY